MARTVPSTGRSGHGRSYRPKVQKIPPAKKTLTREQKDAANARAKAKRDEAREMRAAALEARS